MRPPGGRCRHAAATLTAAALLVLFAACSSAESQPTVLAPTPTADPSSPGASPTSEPEPSDPSAGSAPSTPEPSATAASSPSGSPTDEEKAEPSAPTLEGEAAELTRAGAADFAAYFMRVIDYAYLTGDTASLVAGSLDECIACQTAKGNIEETYASGGHYEGDLTQIQAAESPTIEPTEEAAAFVLYSAPVLVEFDSDGEILGSIPATSDARARFELLWQDGGWKVAGIVSQE